MAFSFIIFFHILLVPFFVIVCFVSYCLIFKLYIFIVTFMYSYCDVCSVPCSLFHCVVLCIKKKGKGLPQQAEVALGVPGRIRPRILSTFSTTRFVGHQPNAPAAFTPREIPGTHFQRLSRPQGTWFCRKEPRKKSQVTPPGIDTETVRLVAQRLNHYATPGPLFCVLFVCKYVLYCCHQLQLTNISISISNKRNVRERIKEYREEQR